MRVLCAFCAITALVVAEQQQCQQPTLHAADPITIVMSTGNGMWNTGVWAGYGEGPVAQLRWAGSGISVDKSKCQMKTPCVVTQDQSKIADADAVLMETVNHPKFGMGSVAFPFIDKHKRNGGKRLLGMFYYEPSVWYPDYTTNAEFAAHFDFTMTPHQNSTIPLTMICPWSRDPSAYLAPAPAKDPANLIAFFNSNGMDPYYENWVRWLMSELGESLHVLNALPDQINTASYRMQLMSTYKFVLVTEQIALDDWVVSEFSQTLVSGSVPVYIGAPNIDEFAPGPNSFVNIRDWITRPPQELASYLKAMAADDANYSQFFEWKKTGRLSPPFQQKLDDCVYYAECRMCNTVAQMLGRA